MEITNSEKGNMRYPLKLFLIVLMCTVFVILWSIIVKIIAAFFINTTPAELMNTLDNNLFVQVATLLGYGFVYVLGIYIFVKKVDKKKFDLKVIGLDINKKSCMLFVVGCIIALLMQLVNIIIGSAVNAFSFKDFGFNIYPLSAVFESLLLVLFASLSAAYGEELLFRGYVQRLLMDKKGKAFALIITSLIFLFLHIQYFNRPLLLIAGICATLVMGYLYILTSSVYCSVGFHFLWNYFEIAIIQKGEAVFPSSYFILLNNQTTDFHLFGTLLGNSTEVCLIISHIILLVILFMLKHAKLWNKYNSNNITEADL